MKLLPRSFRARLMLVAAAAFALRIVYVLTLGTKNPAPINGDYLFFHRAANLLADGHGYIQNFFYYRTGVEWPTANHPPLWPALLSVVSRSGGTSTLAHRLSGVPIGTVTVVVIALIARKIAGDRAALLAASIAAVYPVMVGADGSLLSEPLYGLLVAAVLLGALAIADRPGVRIAALLGAGIGLAALTRSEGPLLLVVVPLALRSTANRWRLVAVTCVAAACVVAPWTARNWVRFREPVLVSTNDGTVLRGANCERTYYGRDIGFWRVDCLTTPVLRNEARRSARWRAQGLRYAQGHASRIPLVVAARELRTWSLWKQSDQLRYAEGRNMHVERAGAYVYYLLVPLAVAGAVLLRKRRTALFVVLTPVAMTVVVTALAYGYTKFRYSAEISIVTLAGVGAARLWEHRSSP